jgi:hypothetical protein
MAVGEIEMIALIKELLTLTDKEIFTRTTIDTKLEIKFLGDNKKVKKDLSNWLAIRL